MVPWFEGPLFRSILYWRFSKTQFVEKTVIVELVNISPGLRFYKPQLSQFSLLAEFFIGKLPVKDKDSWILSLVNPPQGVKLHIRYSIKLLSPVSPVFNTVVTVSHSENWTQKCTQSESIHSVIWYVFVFKCFAWCNRSMMELHA